MFTVELPFGIMSLEPMDDLPGGGEGVIETFELYKLIRDRIRQRKTISAAEEIVRFADEGYQRLLGDWYPDGQLPPLSVRLKKIFREIDRRR